MYIIYINNTLPLATDLYMKLYTELGRLWSHFNGPPYIMLDALLDLFYINNLLDISNSCKRRLQVTKVAKIDSGKWFILILEAKPSLQKDLVVWILLRDNSRNTAGLKVSFKYVTVYFKTLQTSVAHLKVVVLGRSL